MNRLVSGPIEAIAILLFVITAMLFYLLSRPRVPHGPVYSAWVFVLALMVGTGARWVLAWNAPGNYDRVSWQMASDVFLRGGNIYAELDRYHYSPLWFWTLGLIRRWTDSFPAVPFGVGVRLFLLSVDLATALTLWTWPRLSNWEKTRHALFFYLNPVSYLLTGVHGQFENFALFFLVLGLRLASPPLAGKSRWTAAWALGTFAVLVKQVVFFELPVLVIHFFRKGKALALLAASAIVFFLSLASYW